MFRTGLVAKTQPAAIRIYDYYEPGNLQFYGFMHPILFCGLYYPFSLIYVLIFKIRFCSQPSDQVLPIPASEELQHL